MEVKSKQLGFNAIPIVHYGVKLNAGIPQTCRMYACPSRDDMRAGNAWYADEFDHSIPYETIVNKGYASDIGYAPGPIHDVASAITCLPI